jgi:hypothetical protein
VNESPEAQGHEGSLTHGHSTWTHQGRSLEWKAKFIGARAKIAGKGSTGATSRVLRK